uniref:ATP synthase F0 subunit 8 n=1 Tax=Ironoquia dubia TaxID=1875543 RepID=A0A7D7AHU3_9NEOP|nr:ATP synthase F0 subunit 8 [Ironoquia dubia]
MPQMMPLNWTILYILFNLVFYIFMVNNYFNINFQLSNTKITSHLNYNK